MPTNVDFAPFIGIFINARCFYIIKIRKKPVFKTIFLAFSGRLEKTKKDVPKWFFSRVVHPFECIKKTTKEITHLFSVAYIFGNLRAWLQ